ncbi:hypothetical protein Droror1_Dr00013354 [Drosera rotundifolia]
MPIKTKRKKQISDSFSAQQINHPIIDPLLTELHKTNRPKSRIQTKHTPGPNPLGFTYNQIESPSLLPIHSADHLIIRGGGDDDGAGSDSKEFRSWRTSLTSETVATSRVLQETCDYIRSLQREKDDLSERLAEMLGNDDDGNNASAALIRSLLRQ